MKETCNNDGRWTALPPRLCTWGDLKLRHHLLLVLVDDFAWGVFFFFFLDEDDDDLSWPCFLCRWCNPAKSNSFAAAVPVASSVSSPGARGASGGSFNSISSVAEKIEDDTDNYLSCKIVINRKKNICWIGQPHLIKKIEKVFGPMVKGNPGYSNVGYY